MRCSTCYMRHADHVKRGRGTLFGLILGFSSQTLMSLTCYLGRVRVGGGTPPDASFSFFDNFMTLTYLTCGKGRGTPAEVRCSSF